MMYLNLILNKFKNIIKIAYISLNNTDDSTDRHINTISSYGGQYNTMAVYPYGISANAPANTSQTLTFSIQDSKGVTASIPFNQTERFKNLEPNEVKIGNFIQKNNIFFDINGNVIIESTNNGNAKIELNGDNIKLYYGNATLILNDSELVSSVPIKAPSFSDNNVNLSTHTHLESSGGTTGQPQ